MAAAAPVMPLPVAPARPAVAAPKQRLLWPALGLLVLLALGTGAFLLFGDAPLATLRGSGNGLLVAFPGRSGRVELYLLSAGQPIEEGTLLAEDAVEVDDVSYYHLDENSETLFFGGRYGAFVPGTRRVLFWYRQATDDDALINAIRIGDDAPTELLATNALPIWMTSHAGLDAIHIREQRDDQWRCYSAQPGESARRLTKGDYCGAIGDGALVYAEERDDGELTVTIIGAEGGSEELLLDSTEGVPSDSLRFSEDGSHFAYSVNGDDGVELFVMDRANGETSSAGDLQYSLLQHSFIPRRDVLYYLSENDDGDVELRLSNIDAPIARGIAMSAISNRTGEYLLYLVEDEDGEVTAYLYNMGNGDVATLQQGDDLRAALVDDLERIFLWETDADEFSLYSTPLAGGDVSLVFETDDVDSVAMRYVRDAAWVLLEVTDTDGEQSLYAATPDGDGGFYVLEEWSSFRLHDMAVGENRLLLTAVEDSGDDPVLLLAQLEASAPLIELESENEGFLNAVFSANGREVFYTAVTGNSADDVQVVQAPASGEEAGEVLYEEARLDAVSWAEMQPFGTVWFSSWSLRTGSIACPGATTLGPNDDFQARFDGSGSDCYRFRLAAGEMVTFDVRNVTGQSARFHPYVLNRDGETLAEAWYTTDPLLTFVAPGDGLYFFRMDSDEENAAYRLRMVEGNGDAAHGEALFNQVCIACHGVGGEGIEGLGKPLPTSTFVASLSDRELLDFVKTGRPANHPDNTTGVDMPPKGGNPALTDQDILDIISYIRILQ